MLLVPRKVASIDFLTRSRHRTHAPAKVCGKEKQQGWGWAGGGDGSSDQFGGLPCWPGLGVPVHGALLVSMTKEGANCTLHLSYTDRCTEI